MDTIPFVLHTPSTFCEVLGGGSFSHLLAMISGDRAPFKLTVRKMNSSDRKKIIATAKEESVTAAGVVQRRERHGIRGVSVCVGTTSWGWL